MKKLLKKKRQNQGNSFIVVVATISFLAVLVTAILVAVALCYRLKAYQINSRDNFYYLEQAMDEIYAGVGSDAMGYLSEAYDETLEVLVYYDSAKQAYVTMDNKEANKICKDTFLYKLKNSDYYKDTANQNGILYDRLNKFLSYSYDSTSRPEGVKLVIDKNKVDYSEKDSFIIHDLVLERRATYSTVNARSKKTSKKDVMAGDTFVQTITTDLVVSKPAFDVNFNTLATDMEELYKYAIIADMGIEIEGPGGKPATGDKVAISGNVYAAADFYNKSYNENPGAISTVGGVNTTVKSEQIQKVNSYKPDKLKLCNGVNKKSMYSGIYIDGASVLFSSERLIVPGSIAALNCADVSVSTISNSSVDYTDVWADGIVLDGYSLRADVENTMQKSANVSMKARAYISDDLELNANSSSFMLNGEYYGYNYASTDNRKYSDEAKKKSNRVYSMDTSAGITDGSGIEGQAHYNSSAIILNGKDTSLDFSLVKALYVAGQAYIETSKEINKSTTEVTHDINDGGTTKQVTDDVETKTYNYPTKKTEGDNQSYTITQDDLTDDLKDKTAIQDYRTGEAISIKSNQLAYIPNWQVTDNGKDLYVSLPTAIRTSPAYDTYKDIWDNIDKIPIVKTVISGKTYYFFDFSKATWANNKAMNDFIVDYASMFDPETIADKSGLTLGETLNLTNITDYDFFKVKMLQVSTDETGEFENIYTNSAITTKVDNDFTIKAKASNRTALISAANNINNAVNQGTKLGADKVSTVAPTKTLATNVSTKLQNQYKETKWLLTNSCSIADYVTEAHVLTEDYLTPINHFFDFSKIDNNTSKYYDLTCGYGVWISDGDVMVGANSCKIGSDSERSYAKGFKDGVVQGIILAKGDVSFDTSVENFEGLIVTGGKIIINNFDNTGSSGKKKVEMALNANHEVIKSILQECDYTRGKTGDENTSVICDIFRQFVSTYEDPSSAADTPTDTMRNITAVQFEDILSFKNWKKNVD